MNLIWTAAADPAQLEGFREVAFDALDGPVAGPAVAVRGVRLRTVEDLVRLHGYVLAPAWRAGSRLLVESDRKLSELDFDDPWCTLDRALYAARRIWRPEPEPAVPPVDVPGLDAEQLTVVRAPIGPLQVLAPAGSGKTTVLIERTRELLRRGVAAERILTTTFNRDAGRELAERLAAAGVHGVEARTFHSVGRMILVAEGLARPGGVRQLTLNQWKRLCALAQRDTGIWVQPADARAAISEIKLGRLETAAEFDPGAMTDGETVARIYARYEAEQDFDDFDDLVLRAVRALAADRELRRRWQARFEHVLVDEYQDIEPAQERLVRVLAAPQDALMVVGDDDQTLYGFRRASVRRMLDLHLAYPELRRVALAHNYRCPPAVVEASRALIDRNRVRFPKPIEPAPGRTGAAIELHEPATAVAGAARIAASLGGCARGEVVVLARTTNLLRTVALACADAGVRISAPPGVFEPLGARMALEAHLRLCSDPRHARPEDVATAFRTPNRGLPYGDEVAVAERLAAGLSFAEAVYGSDRLAAAGRTLDVLASLRSAPRFIGYLRRHGGLDDYFGEHEAAFGGTEQIELEVLEQAEAEAEGLTVEAYLALLERRTDALQAVRDDDQGVELTTIHRAKGRQWPRVELFACDENQLPHRLALDVTPAQRAAGEGEEAERRLAYVAFTRAQEVLSITATVTAPSRFLTDAGLSPQRPYQPPVAKPRAVAPRSPSLPRAAAPRRPPSPPRAAPSPPDLAAALRVRDRAAAARAIEDKRTGELTVGELLDALSLPEVPGVRASAIIGRLNPGGQRKLVRALQSS